MKKLFERRIVSIVMLFLALGGLTWVLAYGPKGEENSDSRGKKDKVRFSSVASFTTALISIAKERHYFEEEGLEVDVTLAQVGKDALNEMLERKSDFSISAQTAIAMASFKKKDFRILGTVSSTPNLCKLVVRKDKGILKPEDLRGKKINATKGTAFERFFNIYLDKYSIERNELTIVDYELKDAIPLFINGQLDGLVIHEPYGMEVEKELGEKVLYLEATGLYTTHNILLAREDYLRQNPLVAEKLFKALKKASDFYNKDSSECRNFLASHYKMDLSQIGNLMNEIDMRPSLSQQLIYSLEKEARSLEEEGLCEKKDIPVFLDFVEKAPIAKVFPQNVNLIQ